MKKKILSILLASALAFVLLFTGCVPTGSSGGGNTLDSLATDIVALRTKVDAAAAQLDVATRDIETLKAEVTAAGGSSQSLSNIQASISSIQSGFATMQTDIADLKARVAVLEGSGGGGGGGTSDVDPEDAVSCSATYTGTLNVTTNPTSFPIVAGGAKDITIPIKLKLTNELAVDIEDILLTAQINLYPATSSLTVNSAQIYGDIDWNTAWTGSWATFESWSDVEIDASDDDTFTINYKANVTNPAGGVQIDTITVSMRFKCLDYDKK